MATQAHAPLTGGGPRRYRRILRFPITGANVDGRLSICNGQGDTLILGTIAAFDGSGVNSLTTFFGPSDPTAYAGIAVGPPASTAATGPTPNGTTTGPALNAFTAGPSANGLPTGTTTTGLTGPTGPTGSTPSTAPNPLAMNGAFTGQSYPTTSIVNGVPITSITSNPLAMNGIANGSSILPNPLAMHGNVNVFATGPGSYITSNPLAMNGIVNGGSAPIAANPLTMNGAVTGHINHTTSTTNGVSTGPISSFAPNSLTMNHTTSTANGVSTGPISSFAPNSLTMNGNITGHTHPVASNANGVITGPIASILSNPLTMNGGHINTTVLTANGAFTGPPTSITSNPSTMTGAVTGHTNPMTWAANGAVTGPIPPFTPLPLTTNGASTGSVPPTNVMVPIANGATNTTLPGNAANGTPNVIPLIFTPLTSLTGSDHNMPFELTDLLVSFKECRGIFKVIRDLDNDKFVQLAIVSLNDPFREVLNISTSAEVAYPAAHMAGTLKFERNHEVLVFNITWIVDHMVEFTLESSTSPYPNL